MLSHNHLKNFITKIEERYSRRINRQHRVVYKINEDLKRVEIYPP